MAAILNFRRGETRGNRKPPAIAGTATIIIFPGVRYERREGGDIGDVAETGSASTRKPRPSGR